MLGLEQRGTLRGRSLNISETGIAGVFVTVWDVGTPVHLEFSVPVTSSPLRVGGVLRSRSGYRYGFEFVLSSPRSYIIPAELWPCLNENSPVETSETLI